METFRQNWVDKISICMVLFYDLFIIYSLGKLLSFYVTNSQHLNGILEFLKDDLGRMLQDSNFLLFICLMLSILLRSFSKNIYKKWKDVSYLSACFSVVLIQKAFYSFCVFKGEFRIQNALPDSTKESCQLFFDTNAYLVNGAEWFLILTAVVLFLCSLFFSIKYLFFRKEEQVLS